MAMTMKMIDNRMKKLAEIKAQISALEKVIEETENSVKEDMVSKGVDEINTGKYVVRFKEVESNRFDSKVFKKEHADMYAEYVKKSVSKRFTFTEV